MILTTGKVLTPTGSQAVCILQEIPEPQPGQELGGSVYLLKLTFNRKIDREARTSFAAFLMGTMSRWYIVTSNGQALRGFIVDVNNDSVAAKLAGYTAITFRAKR